MKSNEHKYLDICGNRPLLAAAIVIEDKIITGQTHAQAILKAETAGLITIDEYGHIEQVAEGSDALDLFLTKEGKLVNRLEAIVSSSEKADELALMATNSQAYVWGKEELFDYIHNEKQNCCP